MVQNRLERLDTSLPVAQSDNLKGSVPGDLRDDVKEAERAHYHECYKACVTMCRRALQLALTDKGIPDGPLGAMLKQASNLLQPDTHTLVSTIKGFGDIGAHRRDQLEPEEVRMVIYAAVRMLNELF